MYVYSGQPVRHESVLERDLLAQSADLLETALADHAVRGVLRGIHQAVRVDDPSVRQHHGGPYDYLGANLFDIHNATMGVAVNFGMTIVSVLFCAFMNCLELLVACLQAYIFTLLSANYIGLAR